MADKFSDNKTSDLLAEWQKKKKKKNTSAASTAALNKARQKALKNSFKL
jgi:hypothetical protein